MKYAYIDGDDIGLKIESCFMNNDEEGLENINKLVSNSIIKITTYLEENDYKIVFSGADGVICKKNDFEAIEIKEYISYEIESLSFSIGVGRTLNDAYVALRYSKCHGKNKVTYFDNEYTII